jgi:hypothetical protein
MAPPAGAWPGTGCSGAGCCSNESSDQLAARYALTSRPVTVGFHADRRGARLWVQDMGHPVPDDVDVSAARERMRWTDSFRSIHGDGLGLVIVRSSPTAATCTTSAGRRTRTCLWRGRRRGRMWCGLR